MVVVVAGEEDAGGGGAAGSAGRIGTEITTETTPAAAAAAAAGGVSGRGGVDRSLERREKGGTPSEVEAAEEKDEAEVPVTAGRRRVERG